MAERERFRDRVQFEVDPAASGLLPRDFCLARNVAVLGGVPSHPEAPLVVGIADPHDEPLLGEIRTRVGRPIHPIALAPWEVRQAIRVAHGEDGPRQDAMLDLDARRRIRFDHGQRPAQLVDDLLSVAIQMGASDVHIELFRHDVEVRFRVDGHLRSVATALSTENVRHVVSRVKVLCELDPVERRHAQDGHASALYHDGRLLRRVDFRASVVPGPHGEDVVLRVVDPLRFRLDLAELGMSERVLADFRRLSSYPSGLILAVGPTVSGKTNTLYATVHALRERDLKIVTVEDPIEYEFVRVNQKNVTAGMGFAPHVRAFLRQNPDVILVGEVRDPETAETMMQAATTGHLVLSSLHASNAISAIARLRALSVSDDALSSQIVAVVGQRLLARICATCREETKPAAELVARYYLEPPRHPFMRGRGCDACGGTGYRGLTGVFELVEMTSELAHAIGRGEAVESLAEIVAGSEGFAPLLEDALGKVARGETSLEEVARHLAPPRRRISGRGSSARS